MPQLHIAGTGNMAWVLARQVMPHGYSAGLLAGRSQEHAAHAAAGTDFKAALLAELKPDEGDIVVIAVTDNAISDVGNVLPDGDYLLVHTSGSVDVRALEPHSRIAVMYPLQTVVKGMETDLSGVPVMIEASREDDLSLLWHWAHQLEAKPFSADSGQRQRVHLSAVMLNNFSNALAAESLHLLDDAGVPREIMRSLIQLTFSRIASLHPEYYQTGPARRKDSAIIDAHLKLLKEEPELAQLYRTFTDLIQKRFCGKDE